MSPLSLVVQLFLLSAIHLSSAQILSTGNSALPACASSCTKLNQAATACGGLTTSNQQTWICFCQSAYLTTLKTSPVGTCDEVCPDPAQAQQLMTWYNGNCGTDYGASEHNAGAAQPSVPSAATTSAAEGATGTTTSSTGTDAANSATDTSAASNFNPGSGVQSMPGTWWDNHYKWVIMVLVILVGLGIFTAVLIWFKRKHARRQDTIIGGFNAGITTRSTPMTTVTNPAPVYDSTSGRDSPTRTRDAFMPYGYGYSRSDSRLGSRANVGEAHIRGSPLAHDGTTLAALEKSMHDTETSSGKKKKKVYVRERSMAGLDDA